MYIFQYGNSPRKVLYLLCQVKPAKDMGFHPTPKYLMFTWSSGMLSWTILKSLYNIMIISTFTVGRFIPRYGLCLYRYCHLEGTVLRALAKTKQTKTLLLEKFYLLLSVQLLRPVRLQKYSFQICILYCLFVCFCFVLFCSVFCWFVCLFVFPERVDFLLHL